ncbi:MAG: DUF3995 domain-containing protein [Actinobacteria bacterium]|nr:DUF3995 domain-containing protein [Actinomycetota bacterium]
MVTLGARRRLDAGFLANAACLVGLGFAAVSAYWLLGGGRLVETLGGDLEKQARVRAAPAVVAMSIVVALKVLAAVLPAVVIRSRSSSAWMRRLHVLAWIDAAILTVYGLVYTTVGLLVQADVLHSPAGSNEHALAWHTYLWDPWFLVWGLLLLAALLRRRGETRQECG